MKTLIKIIASLSLLISLAAQKKENARPYLGVVTEPLSQSLRTHIDVPDNIGVVISQVIQKTPAEKAGLKKHDIITAINDQKVLSSVPLTEYVQMHKAGDRITVSVIRKSKLLKLQATLGKRTIAPPVIKMLTAENLFKDRLNKHSNHFEKIGQLHKKLPAGVPEEIQKMLEEANSAFDELEKNVEPTWTGLVEPMDAIGQTFEQTWGPIGHLLGVKNSDELREAYETVLGDVITFSLKSKQSRPLYEAVKQLKESDSWSSLEPAQQRIIDSNLRD